MFFLTILCLLHPLGQGRGWSTHLVKCVVVTSRYVPASLQEGHLRIHPLGAITMHVLSLLSPLQLHSAASIVTCHDLIVAVCVLMHFCISQNALPLATSSFMGALHLEVAHSSFIDVVCMGSKLITIDGASYCPFNALPTEQVSTTGLHWVRVQLQTYGTLEFLQEVTWNV